MSSVTVQCSNPQDMRLTVTADYTVGQWEEILRITEDVKYFGPMSDFLIEIRQAIFQVRYQVVMTGEKP